ncbi:hypothetical protein [Sphingopyxis sp. PET50]|uniref:hypothetical protein n=1 Tax=Sphingopyxis sp. PET50 TaxID=2976533 RepID=UPI0021AE72C7|nr:hypothetical protein [Sphingopyxis sp. PET50]
MASFTTDFRVSEYLERRAFPEYDRTPLPASAAQCAIWNLDDTLRAIDEAERILARGWMTMVDHYRVTAALCGRSPDEARAAARYHFSCAYGDAVAAERAAA